MFLTLFMRVCVRLKFHAGGQPSEERTWHNDVTDVNGDVITNLEQIESIETKTKNLSVRELNWTVLELAHVLTVN